MDFSKIPEFYPSAEEGNFVNLEVLNYEIDQFENQMIENIKNSFQKGDYFTDVSVCRCQCCGHYPDVEPIQGMWSVKCDVPGCSSVLSAVGFSKLEAIKNWNKIQKEARK